MEKLSLFSVWFLGFILFLLGNVRFIISLLGEAKGVLLLFVLLTWGEYEGIFLIYGTLKNHKRSRDVCCGVFMLSFIVLWIWSWEPIVGFANLLFGSFLLLCAALKSVQMLIRRRKQPRYQKEEQDDVRIIDQLAYNPTGIVFVGLFFIILSFIFPFMVLHSEPFFDVPTAFAVFYLIGSLDFGFFYYPRAKEVLFRGFVIHGGFTFGPFAIAYFLLSYLGVDVILSIFASPIFHTILTLYMVREITRHEQ